MIFSLIAMMTISVYGEIAEFHLCPKDHQNPFKNKTFCCSGPVDLQSDEEDICYGNETECFHPQGCMNCKFGLTTILNIEYLTHLLSPE